MHQTTRAAGCTLHHQKKETGRNRTTHLRSSSIGRGTQNGRERRFPRCPNGMHAGRPVPNPVIDTHPQPLTVTPVPSFAAELNGCRRRTSYSSLAPYSSYNAWSDLRVKVACNENPGQNRPCCYDGADGAGCVDGKLAVPFDSGIILRHLPTSPIHKAATVGRTRFTLPASSQCRSAPGYSADRAFHRRASALCNTYRAGRGPWQSVQTLWTRRERAAGGRTR